MHETHSSTSRRSWQDDLLASLEAEQAARRARHLHEVRANSSTQAVRTMTVEDLGLRYCHQDAALRGSAQTYPAWSWELRAAHLGIDLTALVDVAWSAAIYEDQQRAGQLLLPECLAIGVGVAQAMREVL